MTVLDINEIKSEAIVKKAEKKNLSGKVATLILFLGRRDKVAANHIVCAIVEEVGLESKQIGKIKVENNFSLIDVPAEYAKDVVKALSKTKIRNQKVKIEEKKK
jgi:ATP-dependent RNA helicase DeaD